jgi:sortase B
MNKKGKKIIASFVLLTAVCTMLYSGSRLMAVEQIYHEGNAVYEELSNKVKKQKTGVSAAPNTNTETQAMSTGTIESPAPANEIDIPFPASDLAPDIDFEILSTINADAVAWLYCPGTVIDYPVMKAEDYNYYLYHLPDGTQNANGSLFIDYNCAPDFSDPLTVIYGHHMKSGSMFGSLNGYKEQGYYNRHPYMYLNTPQGNYRIDLLYGCVIGAGQWRERAFMYKENIDALVAYAAYNTTFQSGAVYTAGDKIAAMSTCSYEFEGARYVVIGIMREID